MSGFFSIDMADLASDGDAAWFKANPARTTRIRPFVEGELPCAMPHGDGHPVTLVRQIRPGVRARLPVYIGKMPPDCEASALAVLRLAMGVGA